MQYFTYFFITSLILLLPAMGQEMLQKADSPLSEYEHNELIKNNTFVKTEEIQGYSWPKLTIYNLISASPLESVAIFAAYDYQKYYIPNLIKSEVIEQVGPLNVHVSYELDLPWPLSNSRYVHAHKLFKDPQQDKYTVNWNMISSTSANKVEGKAVFKEFDGKTLFIYESKVDPKSILSGLVKKNMIKDVKRSLKAVVSHTEWAKQNNKKLLEKYVDKVTTALNGKNAY